MRHVTERYESFAKAILFGNEQDVQDYLDFGAHIDEIDEYGFTPLIEAILANKVAVVEMFLARDCIIDFPDVCGRTPLFWAADQNDIPLCELLIKHKANPNAYTIASQPILVYPILRNQIDLKNCLLKHGAKLTFAQDYITTKMIGHRYEISGLATLYNHNRKILYLEYEGFFLEFTLAILYHSLERFMNHYGGRKLKPLFGHCKSVMRALLIGTELMQHQHHLVKMENVDNRIDYLLDFQPVLIPVGYAGHAVSFILYKNIFVKIDRGHLSHSEGSVVLYQIGNPKMATKEFIRHLIYEQQSKHFVEQGYKEVLQLTPIAKLPIASQKVGNCSWANIEAVIPTMMFLLEWNDQPEADQQELDTIARRILAFYRVWHEWDKDVTLTECIASFKDAEKYRQATKVDMLAAVLFQRCDYRKKKDIERAEKILPIITDPEFDYILKTYLNVYMNEEVTEEGKNLTHLLEICGATFSDWFEKGTYGFDNEDTDN